MVLLAFYQKLKLRREQKQLQLSMARRSTRLKRIQENIKNKEKYYTSLVSQIESQANQMKTAFNANIQMQMNGNFNPFNGCGQGGMFMSAMENMFGTGIKDNTGKELLSGSDLKTLYQAYQTLGQNAFEAVKDDTGNVKSYKCNGKEYSAEQIQYMQQAISQANQYQNNCQYQATNLTTQYGNNISVWVEAQKAQIEAEKETMLEPLHYEETMEQLDKDYEETRLAEIKEELASYEELLKDEIKDTKPSFGLG